MKYLNAAQLAFILDIKKEDARARMCHAWAKHKGYPMEGFFQEKIPGAQWSARNKVETDYPDTMLIDVLSKHLNIPELQAMVDDIERNYINRPGTRKYILSDYPEKLITKAQNDGKAPPYKIDLPVALRGILPTELQQKIKQEWLIRFNLNADKPTICI